MVDINGDFTGYGWYDLLALEGKTLTARELAGTLEEQVLQRLPFFRPYAPAIFTSIREKMDDTHYCRALVDLAMTFRK